MSVFQFTIELRGNHNVLRTWLEHFKRTGMPAGIVEHDGYASVWRVGERRGADVKSDKPVGVLKMYDNGFDKYWQAAGGKIAGEDARRVGWEQE